MDVIEITRQLGAAIQAEPAYIEYQLSKEENDKDEALQSLIGEFNLLRMSLGNELQKDEAEKDQSKVDAVNEQLKGLYEKIMANPSMEKFNYKKAKLDEIINRINSIITLSINGEDPATCEASGCSGSCSSCGGCH